MKFAVTKEIRELIDGLMTRFARLPAAELRCLMDACIELVLQAHHHHAEMIKVTYTVD